MGIAPNLSALLVDQHGDDMMKLNFLQHDFLNSNGSWNTSPVLAFV
jgi:hypothetical protein